jgi:hypothetical protein
MLAKHLDLQALLRSIMWLLELSHSE